MQWAAVGAIVTGATAPAAVMAGGRGTLHGPSPFFSFFFTFFFFSNIYMDSIMYLKYFNEKKPWVP